jgi:beta-glucosidase/6-phospho-beta-glucosidase/beta-galactosidase
LRHLLKWLSDRYGAPEIIITENGVSAPGQHPLAPAQPVCHSYQGCPVQLLTNWPLCSPCSIWPAGEDSKAPKDVICDQFRLQYFQQYIGNATAAVQQDGVRLTGYFAWSLLDNFEWADGYTKRFGIVYVDFSSLARWTKASALWLSHWFGLDGSTAAKAPAPAPSG